MTKCDQATKLIEQADAAHDDVDLSPERIQACMSEAHRMRAAVIGAAGGAAYRAIADLFRAPSAIEPTALDPAAPRKGYTL